jgi:hypothetical protein
MRTEASCELSPPRPDKSQRHIRRDRPAEKPRQPLVSARVGR